ncbi:MAG TPA: hypothetical protein V6C88_17510 [Chroococcidiopsis sp.]
MQIRLQQPQDDALDLIRQTIDQASNEAFSNWYATIEEILQENAIAIPDNPRLLDCDQVKIRNYFEFKAFDSTADANEQILIEEVLVRGIKVATFSFVPSERRYEINRF